MNVYKALHSILQDRTQPRRNRGWKDVLEWACIKKIHNWDALSKEPQIVIGANVRRSTAFASTQIVIGGQACDVPVLAHHCIEALKSKSQRLLRNPPDERHCANLVTAFNSGPSYGVRVDLAHPAQDVANALWLLVRYVEKLPLTLFHPALVHPPNTWCVHPSRTRVLQHEVVRERYAQRTDWHDAPVTHSDAWIQRKKCNIDPTEDDIMAGERKQVAGAALLLRLLPLSVFVLLVYLIDFLLEACTHTEYDITLQEMAEIFTSNCKLVSGVNRAVSDDIFLWLALAAHAVAGDLGELVV